jgi:hypothetical protein
LNGPKFLTENSLRLIWNTEPHKSISLTIGTGNLFAMILVTASAY